ncbi:hypothetical protein ACFY7C_19695 [Streptomyces sp. NPDC012769]|uniref:hypothetical protein n=1 Tax=Streptomyces sp. NPDC012769 TaxID=3364848 RepID=UPI0036D1BF1A
MSTPTPDRPVAPTVSEAVALNNAAADDEIRALVQMMEKQSSLGFDPSTHIKGVITAINYTTAPPTVSVQISGDTTTTISDVHLMSNYSPVVGHTVDIRKQGPDIVVTAHTADASGKVVTGGANGWVKADLTNGSHNGNDQGDVYYRVILDHGTWKMQWRGGWGVSGTFMIDTADALPTEYRPQSQRNILVARQWTTGAVAAQLQFTTDGRVQLVANTQSTLSATSSGDVQYASVSGFTSVSSSHNHLDGSGFPTSFDGSHDHSFGASHDHGFSGGAHSHSVTTPTWISLHGVEYFI